MSHIFHAQLLTASMLIFQKFVWVFVPHQCLSFKVCFGPCVGEGRWESICIRARRKIKCSTLEMGGGYLARSIPFIEHNSRNTGERMYSNKWILSLKLKIYLMTLRREKIIFNSLLLDRVCFEYFF